MVREGVAHQLVTAMRPERSGGVMAWREKFQVERISGRKVRSQKKPSTFQRAKSRECESQDTGWQWEELRQHRESGKDGARDRSRGPLRAVSAEEMAFAKPCRVGAGSGWF